jgi:hypothetical protein
MCREYQFTADEPFYRFEEEYVESGDPQPLYMYDLGPKSQYQDKNSDVGQEITDSLSPVVFLVVVTKQLVLLDMGWHGKIVIKSGTHKMYIAFYM